TRWWPDTALPSRLAHPFQVAVAFFDGHVEICPRQLLPEGADVKRAFNLTDAPQLFLRPGRHTVCEWRSFHWFNQSQYTITSGSQAKALLGISSEFTKASLASTMYFWRPYACNGFGGRCRSAQSILTTCSS